MTAAEPASVERDPREYLVPNWRRAEGWKPWRPQQITWEDATPERRTALRAAWSAGNLRYKLNPDQDRVYEHFREWLKDPRRGLFYVLDIARRYGKTVLAVLIAIEDTIRGGVLERHAYWADTEKMARNIVVPVMNKLLLDCPPDLRPTWMRSAGRLTWPDGRVLEVCGLDDPDSARGRDLHAGVLDEAGFMTRLDYIINSVIDDQTQGHKGAYVLITSTPPDSSTHYFSTHCVPLARAEGAYQHRTIYDNPMLATEDIEARIARRGGISSVSVRREMLAEHLTDPESAVVPEYQEARRRCYTPPPQPPPQWRHCFVSMDPGWVDGTGILFAYWHYWEQRLVVEAEHFGFQMQSKHVADVVRGTERRLWSDAQHWNAMRGEAVNGVTARWTDIEKRLIADLRSDHDISFWETRKDNLAQQVVRLREWIDQGKILVSKDCPQLDAQLASAVYKNSRRSELAQSADKGHFDLVMALVYLVRNADAYTQKNPAPPWYTRKDNNQQRSWAQVQEAQEHAETIIQTTIPRPTAIGARSKFRTKSVFRRG